MSPIELAIFISRSEAICHEMGLVLRTAAFSPNIKDRLDFSCALFDANGELFSQAAHIPVHLGSMAYAMASIVSTRSWRSGDLLCLNDPFLGGTHLPDVTVVSPVFAADELIGFVANRAHHANIGADSPGSMPISRHQDEEGLTIPPTLLIEAGVVNEEAMASLGVLSGAESGGDFAAQISANRRGVDRMLDLVNQVGVAQFVEGITATNEYGERLARAVLIEIPEGEYTFDDVLDDDGFGHTAIPICATLVVTERDITVDFTGSSGQVEGNLNCPLSVAASAVFYCFRCLLPENTPACAGVFRCINLSAPKPSLLNAERPAATSAGNVETSMRVVDVVLGALSKALPGKLPAASQGTMNNIALGNHTTDSPWDYYETMAGGAGATANGPGASAIHTHMTNTLNTPIESLEMHYPLRVDRYEIRTSSGGNGQHRGGDGLVREMTLLEPAELTLITERRETGAWGLNGGAQGASGSNLLDGEPLPAKCQKSVSPGQRITVITPGGGGYGQEVGSS